MLNNKIKNFIFQKFFHNNGNKIDYVTNLKDYFDKNLKKIKKSDNILKVIQNILEDLSKQNHINYYIYSKISEKSNLWKTENSNLHWNITVTDSKSFSDKSLVNISRVHMKSDSSPNEITNNILEINLPGEDLFYIEARNCDSENLFYFKSELQTFFQNYLYEREIQSLKAEQKKNEKRFEESEKKVISANKEVRRKVYELHNLVEASNDIYSILDFKQLINSSLLTIIGQVGFQKAFVLLYNNENNKFDLIFNKGFADNKFENLEFDLSSPIVRYFFKNRTPLYPSRLEQNKDLKSFAKKLNKMGIIVIAPLIYSERLQGVIGAGEKLHFQNFSEADFEIFHILVNIISISIGNSRLFQEIRTFFNRCHDRFT